MTNFSASVSGFPSRWARIFVRSTSTTIATFSWRFALFVSMMTIAWLWAFAPWLRRIVGSVAAATLLLILFCVDFVDRIVSGIFHVFACLALSSNALPSFNRASSVGFSGSARRRWELEVHVKIMWYLISLSMSLNLQVFASWRSLVC